MPAKILAEMPPKVRRVEIRRAVLALLEKLDKAGGSAAWTSLVQHRRAHVRPLYEAALEQCVRHGMASVRAVPCGKRVYLLKKGREEIA